MPHALNACSMRVQCTFARGNPRAAQASATRSAGDARSVSTPASSIA